EVSKPRRDNESFVPTRPDEPLREVHVDRNPATSVAAGRPVDRYWRMFAYYRHVVKAARPLRVAIVGYGQMGQIRRDVLRSSPDFELVAIAEVATRVFDAEDVTVCRSPTEVYILEPDAVFVCTPPNRTTDIVIEALEHGCHVFA